MRIKKLLSNETLQRIVAIVLLLIVAIASMTKVSDLATSPDTYKSTIQSIDEKKVAVMGVSATAAVASAGLAAIPGESTTPIANQIMDLSSCLFVVVCVLVLEKSLLTVLGFLSFKFLIPLSCFMLGIHIIFDKKRIKTLAYKFIAFAIIIVCVIPISMGISDKIYEVNKTTVDQVSDNANINTDEPKEDESWIEKLVDKVKKATSNAGEKAKQILNSFIDAIAVFIIAYCAIPIIVVIFAIWFINHLFGLNIENINIKLKRRRQKRNLTKQKQKDEKELTVV